MLRATLLAAALLPRVDALSRRRLAAMAVASPSKYRRGGGRPARGGGGGAAESDFVFGVAPVLNALERGGGRREALHRLHVQGSIDLAKRKDKGAVLRIRRAADAAGVEVVESDKGRMNTMVGNRPHQGFVLEAAPIDFIAIDRLDDAPDAGGGGDASAVWLALDEVRAKKGARARASPRARGARGWFR